MLRAGPTAFQWRRSQSSRFPLVMRITAGHLRRELMMKLAAPLVPLLLTIFFSERTHNVRHEGLF